jgi:hypothetical protein
MYSFAHDEANALAVWVVDHLDAEEWQLHFDHLRELAQWSTRTKRRAAVVLVPGNAFDRPNALIRAELARLSEVAGDDPFLALVTPNVAARGLLTMIQWVQRRPRWELEDFGDASAALYWLERRRGAPLPALRIMVDRTLRRAREHRLRVAV